MKRKLSIILALVFILSTVFCVNTFAASYPSISSSKYIEFMAQQNINVYMDSACRTRGTSSPSKKYNASISRNDVCYIYSISSSYIKVNYPTSSGRRTGYIRRSDLFDKTAPEEYISSAKASVTVYKAYGNSSIARGDKVWRVDPKNEYNGYCAVIYDAKSGKRAYKLGYITLNDLNRIKNETASNPAPSNDNSNDSITNRLNKMIRGEGEYAKFKVGIKYTGPRSNEQCKGFARTVHNNLFGYDIGSTKSKPSNYKINYSSKNTVCVGSITNMSNKSDYQVKTLFDKARPGDFIQIRRSHTGSHSAIFVSSSSSGVTWYEANIDGKNTISLNTYTWATLREKNAAMTVYTAKNYN